MLPLPNVPASRVRGPAQLTCTWAPLEGTTRPALGTAAHNAHTHGGDWGGGHPCWLWFGGDEASIPAPENFKRTAAVRLAILPDFRPEGQTSAATVQGEIQAAHASRQDPLFPEEPRTLGHTATSSSWGPDSGPRDTDIPLWAPSGPFFVLGPPH